jgi:uncharacterized tellurite resistance protein B-like protein
MTKPNYALVPALAKTLLAIAWADGELHPEEETTLKEVVGLLPAMSAKEWAVIELYLLTPITIEERAVLLQNLRYHIRSADDKRLALDAVDSMLRADGTVHLQEEAVARDIRATIEAVDVSMLGMLKRTLEGVAQRTPARENGLALWQGNPILYLLRIQQGADTSDVDQETIEVASLAGALMAQVVHVTPATAEDERPVLVRALLADWQLPQSLAEHVADIALSIADRNIDFYRISRDLARRASEAQRIALLDTLFAIANAADQVSPDEIDEIRIIAERLNLTRQHFVNAKLKIPAVDRGGL